MAKDIEIRGIEQDGPSGLIVTFSDGTSAGYLVEELLELRPHRLLVRETLTPTAAGTTNDCEPNTDLLSL